MIEWALVAAAGGVLGAGAYSYNLFQRAKAHKLWKSLLEDYTQGHPGRVSMGSIFDGPEVRIDQQASTVTIKLQQVHRRAQTARASTEGSLSEVAARIYLGWDTSEVPAEMSHLSLVEYAGLERAEGEVLLRGDDSAATIRFFDAALIDLLDLRREAQAHGLEVIIRGGYLRLVVYGLSPSDYLIERLAKVHENLLKIAQESVKGTQLGPG